jgi:hypothetical protein
MRIPLIVAGAAGSYPFAYLRAGKWGFECTPPDVRVSIESPPLPAQDSSCTLELVALTPVRAMIQDLGPHRNVTVYACLIP